MTTIGSIILSLISAIIGGLVAGAMSLRTAIHGEADWRQKAFELARIKEVKDEDILILRSLVNPYYKYGNPYDLDNIIIQFCGNSYGKINDYNIQSVTLKCRVCARTLLKADWTVTQHPLSYKWRNRKLVYNLNQFMSGKSVEVII